VRDTRRSKKSSNILQAFSQFLPEFVNVAPMRSSYWTSDVVNGHLGFVKDPLNHEERGFECSIDSISKVTLPLFSWILPGTGRRNLTIPVRKSEFDGLNRRTRVRGCFA
jgi:hypothetical protein